MLIPMSAEPSRDPFERLFIVAAMGMYGSCFLSREPASRSSVSWQPPEAASLGSPQLSRHGHALLVPDSSRQHRTSLGAFCTTAPRWAGWLSQTILLPFPLSQVSRASRSGSFLCLLLPLPIIFHRHNSEYISYFSLCLGIWFLEDQINTSVYFPLPFKLVVNKTEAYFT